jgi:hypothetical protein
MKGDKALQRRMFLRAMAVGLTVPLAAKVARLASAAPGDRPRRLFIMYLPHGSPVEHFDPAMAGSTLDLAARGVGVLSALEPYKSYVTPLRGLAITDATNHAAIRATLTGSSEGGSNDSIDYVIAQALGQKAHVLGAVPYTKGAGFTSDSYLTKHGSWVRATEDPVLAADDLLAGLGEPDPMAVDESVFRTEALGLTEAELDSLQQSLSSLTSEQTKLKIHLDAVRALKASPAPPMAIGCDSRPVLPAVEAARGLDVLEPTNFGKILEAHLELAAYSFLCGTANIVTLQCMHVNSTLNMGFAGGPGFDKGHHDPISHSWDAAGREEFAITQRWFYDRLAQKFLAVLDQPDPSDPSGNKVIDNTLVAVCTEVSDGANHHSNAEPMWINNMEMATYLPFTLIGGASGYLTPGRIVDVTSGRSHVDALATLADYMGAPQSTIGGKTATPIAEVKA